MLEVQASIVDVLKIRNSQQQQNILPIEIESVVYVEKLVVCDDCTLIINLTDGTRHEYVANAKLWREISSIVELPEPLNYQLRTSIGQDLTQNVSAKVKETFNFK